MSSRLKTLNTLFNSPLSIARSASTGLKMTMALFLEMKGFNSDELKQRGFLKSNSQRPATDWDGEAIQQMEIVDNIAIIPINGIMMADIPAWAKEMGYCDVLDVIEDIDTAMNTTGLQGIAFDVDSPGGATMAGYMLFDAIKEVVESGMPVMAYASGTMASAALQAILPANVIYASPYSDVGSVGTYTVISDDSEFWANMGITFEVIASGKFKGMGITSLTADQRNFIQQRTNDFGAQFRANVSQYRSTVTADDMEGQYWQGPIAAQKGFVDGIKKDLQNALANFSEMIEGSKSSQ